jgi:hypothetical protein
MEDQVRSDLDTKRKALLQRLTIVEACERTASSPSHFTIAEKVAAVLTRIASYDPTCQRNEPDAQV